SGPTRKRRRWPRIVLGSVAVLVVLGVVAWRYQSQLIGIGAHWWLGHVASQEASTGEITRRQAILARGHRSRLMAAPPDPYVPELFELVTQLSNRVATGEIALPWAAYVYTAYERDLERDRPTGEPRRTPDEVKAEIARVQEFYHIQKRPD